MATGLIVCAPMRVEARALGAGSADCAVLRTGRGCRRSTRSAVAMADHEFRAMAVAGLAGGLDPTLRSGDVVVGTELRGPAATIRLSPAPVLVEALGEVGLTVRSGPILTVDHLVGGSERAELALSRAVAVDTESAVLATAAGARPLAVVRVVLDTAEQRLSAPGTPWRALAALRRLRSCGPPLARWAEHRTAVVDP